MFVKLVKKTWLFRKIEKIKDLYFEKLLDIIGKVDAINRKLDDAAANDTSVMQTLVYLVEAIHAAQQQQQQQQQKQQIHEVVRHLASIEGTLKTVGESLDSLSVRIDELRERGMLRLDGGARESLDAFSRGFDAHLQAPVESHADAGVK